MRLVKLNEDKLEEGKYYLVKNLNWAASGYTIAEYDGVELICQSNDRAIPMEDIEGVEELD